MFFYYRRKITYELHNDYLNMMLCNFLVMEKLGNCYVMEKITHILYNGDYVIIS